MAKYTNRLDTTRHNLFLYSAVKSSTLNLGLMSLCTPWPDGSASSVGDILWKTVSTLKLDNSRLVSSQALSALRVFEACMTPRAPPLIIHKREQKFDKIIETTKNPVEFSHLLEYFESLNNEFIVSQGFESELMERLQPNPVLKEVLYINTIEWKKCELNITSQKNYSEPVNVEPIAESLKERMNMKEVEKRETIIKKPLVSPNNMNCGPE